MFIDLTSDAYRNLTSCENQSGVFICDHEGACNRTCPCRINRTTCREGCNCPQDCPHRFPYCQCETCGTECPCKNNGRECIPGKCRQGKCTERCSSIYPARPLDSLTVKKSAIPGAGNGLFTQEAIKSHRFISRYTGDILPDKQVKEFGEREMTAFTISQDMSIQGISPTNWAYWVNHPPAGPPNKTNAMFFTVEGPTERFIVLMSTRYIAPNTEIFAEYSSDYTGFEGLSKDHELWTPELPDTTKEELKVGEYVLIKGYVGGPKRTERTAEVWVGMIAQTYENDKYGVHWLYHHSHLEKGVQFPECPLGQAPSFEPWELIMSEHTSIVDADKIMTRVEMMERARESERKVGTWWWDWVLSFDRKYQPTRKRWTNVPVLVSSNTYFKNRIHIDPWDLVLKSKGLTPIMRDEGHEVTAEMSTKLTFVRKSKNGHATRATKVTKITKVKSNAVVQREMPRRAGLRGSSQQSSDEKETPTTLGKLPVINRERFPAPRSSPDLLLNTINMERITAPRSHSDPLLNTQMKPSRLPNAHQKAQKRLEVTTITRKRTREASELSSSDQIYSFRYPKRKGAKSYLDITEIMDSEEETEEALSRESTPYDKQRDSVPLPQSPALENDGELVNSTSEKAPLNHEHVDDDVKQIRLETEQLRYANEAVHFPVDSAFLEGINPVQSTEKNPNPSDDSSSVEFIESRPVNLHNNRLVDFDDNGSLHFDDNGPADFDDIGSSYFEDNGLAHYNNGPLHFGNTGPPGLKNPILCNNPMHFGNQTHFGNQMRFANQAHNNNPVHFSNPIHFDNQMRFDHQAHLNNKASAITVIDLTGYSDGECNTTTPDKDLSVHGNLSINGAVSMQSTASTVPTTTIPSVGSSEPSPCAAQSRLGPKLQSGSLERHTTRNPTQAYMTYTQFFQLGKFLSPPS